MIGITSIAFERLMCCRMNAAGFSRIDQPTFLNTGGPPYGRLSISTIDIPLAVLFRHDEANTRLEIPILFGQTLAAFVAPSTSSLRHSSHSGHCTKLSEVYQSSRRFS